MVAFHLATLILVPLAQFAKGNSVDVTPVQKVVSLLYGLQATLENESAQEKHQYGIFLDFCNTKNASLVQAIADGRSTVESLTAEIGEKNATKKEKSSELEAAKVKLEEDIASLEATKVRAAKGKAEYESNDADLTEALSSLESAIHAMNTTKPTAQLITMGRRAVQNAAVSEAMKLLDAGWRKNTAFLQSRVDPSDPAYKYHSQDIISTMQNLHVEFTQKKTDADAEYVKAKAAIDRTIDDLNQEISDGKDNIASLEDDIAKLAARIGEATQELFEANAQLADDVLYYNDLNALCAKRADEFKQRSAMRAEELAAIAKAISILEQGAVEQEEFTKRALVQVATNSSLEEKRSGIASFFQRAQVREHSTQRIKEKHTAKALELLGSESRRIGSSMLSAVVARAAADPFAKIKTLIQALIERLLRESTQEATKKGFCDTEMGNAQKDRDFRWEDVKTLSADIAQLAVKQDELELDMERLQERLAELADIANETFIIREQEKAENLQTLANAKEGFGAVKDATEVLKVFYARAARATALSQVGASPVDEDNPGAGFDGKYGGEQAGAKGVLGFLEVIKSDFERTIRTIEEAETKSYSDYVAFDQATKSDQSAKKKKIELHTEDLETTKVKTKKKMDDMKSNMNLLDSALLELEELKPMCVDNVMSYEERVAKREEEIVALKKALCILDPEGVEDECT